MNRYLKILSLGFLLSLPCAAAWAQSVQQSGTVTRGHVAVWNTSGVIGDGGSSASSPISSLGITNNGGAGVCVNSALPTAPGYQALCLGAATNGPATISLQNFGSAPTETLNFVVNGTTYPFPGSLANITIGITPVVGGTNSECLFVSGGFVGQQACTLSAITSLLGDGTATGPGASVLTLATVNSSPGTFGSGAVVPIITVNGKGLITGVSTASVGLTVGSSTITGGVTNSILYQNGTVLGELSVVGNAVLGTNISGVPSLSTTLPSALTIPSPTFTGTETFPDSATWSNLGVSKVAALSAGSATLPSGGNINVSGQYQVNGSQIAASNLSNGTTGTGNVVLQTSPTLAGTVGGNITLSGNLTLSGNDTFSGQAIYTGTSAPTSAAGNTVVMGTTASPTLSNNGQAYFYNSTTGGAVVQGDGSTGDVSFYNKSGALVFNVPTGTTKLNFPSLASGACTAGLGLDSGNNTVLVACPGASSSIQVGTTLVNSGASGAILYDNAGVLGNATVTGPLQNTGGAFSINATTTAHTLPIWEGASAMANVGVGTLGQFVGSGGAGVDPSMQSGPWTLLATLTASGSSVLSDTTHITSNYADYKLVFSNLIAATTSSSCQLQMHSGGAFQATGYVANGFAPNGTAIVNATTTTTFIPLCNNSSQGTGTPGMTGEVIVFNPSSSAIHPVMGILQYNGALSTVPWTISGFWNTAAVVDGFEFSYSAGNIASGTIKIYGRL